MALLRDRSTVPIGFIGGGIQRCGTAGVADGLGAGQDPEGFGDTAEIVVGDAARQPGGLGNTPGEDLGRVLALAHLASRDVVEMWLEPWLGGLDVCFPGGWRGLAQTAGSGLRSLLEDEVMLEEARHTC